MQTNKMWIIKYAFHVTNFPHLKIIFMDLTVSLILLLLLLLLRSRYLFVTTSSSIIFYVESIIV